MCIRTMEISFFLKKCCQNLGRFVFLQGRRVGPTVRHCHKCHPQSMFLCDKHYCQWRCGSAASGVSSFVRRGCSWRAHTNVHLSQPEPRCHIAIDCNVNRIRKTSVDEIYGTNGAVHLARRHCQNTKRPRF